MALKPHYRLPGLSRHASDHFEWVEERAGWLMEATLGVPRRLVGSVSSGKVERVVLGGAVSKGGARNEWYLEDAP